MMRQSKHLQDQSVEDNDQSPEEYEIIESPRRTVEQQTANAMGAQKGGQMPIKKGNPFSDSHNRENSILNESQQQSY